MFRRPLQRLVDEAHDLPVAKLLREHRERNDPRLYRELEEVRLRPGSQSSRQLRRLQGPQQKNEKDHSGVRFTASSVSDQDGGDSRDSD